MAAQTGQLELGVNRIWFAPTLLQAGNIASGADARTVRDTLITPNGGGFGFENGYIIAERVTVGGAPGLRFHYNGAETIVFQIYARFGGQWTLIEPGTSVQITGLTLTACTPTQCSAPAAGGVPAVSQWGLAIMGLLVLIGGSLAIVRKARGVHSVS